MKKIKFSQPWIKIENIYKNEEFENLIKEKNKIISINYIQKFILLTEDIISKILSKRNHIR